MTSYGRNKNFDNGTKTKRRPKIASQLLIITDCQKIAAKAKKIRNLKTEESKKTDKKLNLFINGCDVKF